MKNKQMLGNLLLILTAMIWGMAFAFQRKGMESIEPVTFTAVRMGLAAVVVGMTAFLFRKREDPDALSDAEKVICLRNTVIGGICCGAFLASSASAYHKPAAGYIITEGTTLANPHWQYSRDKIACEEFLMKKYREEGFPVTIVRPSHTYDERHIPLGVHGKKGFWQVIRRMQDGKPVIIQGDGTSLWTLTFNKDFAIGYTGLMGNWHAIGEAFQITGDETLTWNQIYATIADALGVELRAYHVSSEFLAAIGEPFGYDFEGSLIGDKAVSVVFDNSKLKRAVPDMRTTVRYDQGVRIALNYILSHPEECQVEDPEFDEWCDNVISALENAKQKLLDKC